MSNGTASGAGTAPAGSVSSSTGASASSASATRRVSVRNSIFVRNPSSSSATGSRSSRSSSPKGSSIPQSSCTSRFDIRIRSACSIRTCRRLGCVISSARDSSVSTSPNSWISAAAVLIPIPGAPGTLSVESPASACTSTTLSGPTPNFASTPSTPMRTFFIASIISTPPPTSCIRSLSELTIVTRPPASRARHASVAMMSSASNPSSSSQAMLNARVASRVRGICGRRSSGISGRWPL